MAVGRNGPAIIKRKKPRVESRHHNGAWKVAYADFVTAMMAFFLLMWLLNATDEKQRKGLSEYFNPTIVASRISGGGEDAFNGDSIFSEESEAQIGSGGTAFEEGASSGFEDDHLAAESTAALREVEKRLLDRGGESRTMRQLLRHVVTRVSDEGLVIELYDLEDARLFHGETARPEPVTLALLEMIGQTISITKNPIAINAHLRSLPRAMTVPPVWQISAERAQAVRQIIEKSGIYTERIHRVSGHADRKPVTPDPSDLRNSRIEIVLLRKDR